MKLSGHKLFYAVLIVSVLMVNPPIVFWFNDYCVEHPLLFGWPTMYIWLEFWFLVMILLLPTNSKRGIVARTANLSCRYNGRNYNRRSK